MSERKAMLSQPMAGKTEKEIIDTRNRAVAELEKRGFKLVNTLFTDEWYNPQSMEQRGVAQIPLCFLAKSLENMSLRLRFLAKTFENMSLCHAAYF